MSTYTLSVIGVGMGGRQSVRAAVASDHFELTAIADLSPAARETLAAEVPGIQTFASHEDLFAQCPTDLVCVATYAPTHKPVTLAALEQLPLKGLLVEKPLAHTYADGNELVTAVQDRRLPLAVPHGLLVSPHVAEIRERVGNGDLGELQLVEVECGKWDLINAGIHWLNFLVVLLGEDRVVDVLCACDTTTETWRDGMQVETVSVALFTTAAGVRCLLHMGDDVGTLRQGKPTLFRLVGAKGLIEFWAFENAYWLVDPKHPGGELVTPAPAPVAGHRAHLENLVPQMASQTPDYTLANSSLRALELVEAAYLSHRHRCRVTLPLGSFTPPSASPWDPGRPRLGSGGGRDGRKLT